MENSENDPSMRPYIDAGFKKQGLTNNGEDEIWVNKNSKKILFYAISDGEITGPCDVKD